jgi:outer membrane protein assembly factor BamB
MFQHAKLLLLCVIATFILTACGQALFSTPPPPPTINLFKAFPSTVVAGETVTLTWDATAADDCVASNSWAGTRASSDRQTLTLSAPGTTQYTLTCTNAGGSDAETVSVTTIAAPALPAATTVQVTPDHSGSIKFNSTITYPASSTWSVNFPGLVSYPLIAGGRVFVTVANGSGGGSKLYALNQDTGATIWGPTPISGTYPWSNATYSNGKVFVIQVDGTLLSFDAVTGTPGWSVNLPGQYFFDAPPTAFGGMIYVGGAGSGGTLYAVNESNGAVRWTQSVANGNKSSASVTSGGLYVTYPCQTYAFDPDNGTPLWHNQNGCSGGGGRTSPVKNNILYARYFAVSNNSLNFFDAITGSSLGSGSSDKIPAITATQAFVMNSGTLQAINLSTGQISWSFAGDGNLITAPIVINDRVIVGSNAPNGPIYAVDVATGIQQWSSAAGAPLAAQDEQNVSAPISGLNAGEGFLIAPAGTRLTAWKLTP